MAYFARKHDSNVLQGPDLTEIDLQIKDYQDMDSNALRKPAAKAIFDEFIMPDLLARDHVSTDLGTVSNL